MSPTLRPAGPADVEPLLVLMDGVVAWLVARGRAGQWGSRPLSADPAFRARLAEWVATGRVTVAVRDGAVVGAVSVDAQPPAYVPAGLVPPGARYVHALVSARTPAGAGAGRVLLDALTVEPGPVALDHWAGSPELAALYAAAGFRAVGRFVLAQPSGPWPGTVRLRP